ncbi:unnamed protein product [Lathyrus oleraceus]
MSDRDWSCEFRIRICGLRIRDREVERAVLVFGFYVRSSTAADDELWRGRGLVRRPGLKGMFERDGRGLECEGDFGSPLLKQHGPRPIALLSYTVFSSIAPPFRLGLSCSFTLGPFWTVCFRFILFCF